MLPPAILDDPKKTAEKKVFEALKRLPQGWCVFYSVSWSTAEGWVLALAGEIDFLLVHPQFGVVILEVVGGAVGYLGQERWVTCDREGQPHRVFPQEQLAENRRAMVDLLRSTQSLANQSIPVSSAIVVPDIRTDDRDAGLIRSGELLIGKEHLHDLAKRLFEIGTATRTSMAAPRQLGTPGCRSFGGEDLVRTLRDSLTRVVFSRNPLAVGDDAELLRLTADQSKLFRYLQNKTRVCINGCAGAGKTLLAAEKARQLAMQGYRTLFTCHNRDLAEHLKISCADVPNLVVGNFHSICKLLAEKADISLPQEISAYHQALNEAIANRPDLCFDAIIVDEAHDFRREWWTSIEAFLHDRQKSILYLFNDENQKIFFRENYLPKEMARFELTENLRSPRAIFVHLRQHIENTDDPVPQGPIGRAIDTITYLQTEEDGEQSNVAAPPNSPIAEPERDSRHKLIDDPGTPPVPAIAAPTATFPVAETEQPSTTNAVTAAMLRAVSAAVPGAVSAAMRRASLANGIPPFTNSPAEKVLTPKSTPKTTISWSEAADAISTWPDEPPVPLAERSTPTPSTIPPTNSGGSTELCGTTQSALVPSDANSALTSEATVIVSSTTVQSGDSTRNVSETLASANNTSGSDVTPAGNVASAASTADSAGDCALCKRPAIRHHADSTSRTEKAQVATAISNALTQLIDREGCQVREIVVLTPRVMEKSCLPFLELQNGFRLVTHECTDTRNIRFASLHKFKGMERANVILCEIDDQYLREPRRSPLSYIALSRAKVHLIVVGTVDGIDGLLDFPSKSQEEEQAERRIRGLRALVSAVYGDAMAPADILKQRGFDQESINRLGEHAMELMQYFVHHLRVVLMVQSEELIQYFDLEEETEPPRSTPARWTDHAPSIDFAPSPEDSANMSMRESARTSQNPIAFPDTLKPVIDFALTQAAADILWAS